MVGHADVDVESERFGELVVEEGAEGAAIHPAHRLAGEEPEGEACSHISSPGERRRASWRGRPPWRPVGEVGVWAGDAPGGVGEDVADHEVGVVELGHTDVTGWSRPSWPRCTKRRTHAPVTGLMADQVWTSDRGESGSVVASTTSSPATTAATATPGPQAAIASAAPSKPPWIPVTGGPSLRSAMAAPPWAFRSERIVRRASGGELRPAVGNAPGCAGVGFRSTGPVGVGVTAGGYPCPSRTEPQERALIPQTVLEHDEMHHLVNGLSLEVSRQAERIRRRSHGHDWPSAASAMAELEEAVQILGRIVNVTLRSSIQAEVPQPESEPDEQLSELPTGQYL